MTTNTVGNRLQSGKGIPRLMLAASLPLFAAGLVAGMLHTRAEVAIALRWVALALFVPVALRRRSLLLWTFFAILPGAELGFGAPHFAAQAHFLGALSLRLTRRPLG